MMMRCWIAITMVAALAGCSQGRDEQHSAEDLKTFDAQEPPAPGVYPTAAPGVAFNYRYAFRLPSNRISAAQEAHAAACERLGVAKCRITGMRYRLVNDRDVSAMLALRLDPALARQFGKQATEVVSAAEGMLVDQEITGEDVGSRIAGANLTEADLRDELRRIEAELARPAPVSPPNGAPPPPMPVDRTNLTNRAEEIRAQLRSRGERRSGDQAALAGTPMVFNYGSGSVVPGFDVRSPVKDALQAAMDNFITALGFVLVLLATLLPWLLVGGLLWWLYGLLARRFGWPLPGRREPIHEEPAGS
jgi:hypothetical protein